MREGRYEASEQASFATAVTFLLIGLGAGTLIGLLFAPKAGKQMRRDLRRRYEDARETIENWREEARGAGKRLWNGEPNGRRSFAAASRHSLGHSAAATESKNPLASVEPRPRENLASAEPGSRILGSSLRNRQGVVGFPRAHAHGKH